MRRVGVGIVLALAVAGGGAAQPLADLVITGGTIVTMDPERRVIEGGAVVVNGRRIDAVLTASDPRPQARETLDARGHLIIPGLVNAHGHAAMTLLRGIADDLALLEWLEGYIFPAESRNVSPEFVYLGTLLGCVEMVRSGTTTYADMYYFEEQVARATVAVGHARRARPVRHRLPRTRLRRPPRRRSSGAERFIEAYADHPLIVPSIAPHALYTTPLEIVREAAEIARRHGVPFQIHAVEPPEENDQMMERLGKRTIVALDDAGVLSEGVILHHAIWMSEDDIDRVARSGAATSHNPESNMKTASGLAKGRSLEQLATSHNPESIMKTASGLAKVPEQLAAGIAVGLGTDGPASNNNLDMFEEMDSAAKLHKLVRARPDGDARGDRLPHGDARKRRGARPRGRGGLDRDAASSRTSSSSTSTVPSSRPSTTSTPTSSMRSRAVTWRPWSWMVR